MRTQDSSNLRLVCITELHEKVAFWGTQGKNTVNIDRVLQKGLPCEIECEYIEPNEVFRNKFGHKFWVPENAQVEIL